MPPRKLGLMLRDMLPLVIPIALQNLISLGLNLTDTIMLGSLGEKQISASALANQPFFIFSLLLYGIASGACVLTAQYWGRGDMETIRRVAGLAIKAAMSCAAVFTLVVLLIPETVMSLYTSDAQVIALGAQFLRIIGFSYILSSISTTYLIVLRSVEKVAFPLLISFTSFLVNVLLNWVLIFGNWGAPAMEIRGSAAATLCARILELLLVLAYAAFLDKRLRLRLRDLKRVPRLLRQDFLRYSIPVVMNETFWAAGISMQSVIIGHLGTRQVAAASIAGLAQRLGTIIVIGVGSAAAVMIGKQIGARNEQEALSTVRGVLFLSLALGVISGIFLFLIRAPMLSLYNVDEQTRSFALTMIAVYAAMLPLQSFNTVNIIGVLRGGGDTLFAMRVDIGTLWLMALPLGALAGFVWNLPIALTFFLLICDDLGKFVFGVIRLKSGRWLNNVTH